MMREQVAQDVAALEAELGRLVQERQARAAQVAELDGQILMQRGALGYARMVLEREEPLPRPGGSRSPDGGEGAEGG
jgi:hypothetical protein